MLLLVIGLVYINISLLFSLFLILISLFIFMGSLFIWCIKYRVYFHYELFFIFSSPINFSFILDPKGMLFRSVVLFISSNVLFYAKYYISGDLSFNRFIYLVLAFVLSMNFLIFIPNFMGMLLG